MTPGLQEQVDWITGFLDPYLLDDAPPEPKREIHYFTMGEDRWKVTQQWPPEDIAEQRWYLAEDRELSNRPPSGRNLADQYAVDFNAGTGILTRWATSMGGTPIDYGDRAAADELLLAYTSRAAAA